MATFSRWERHRGLGEQFRDRRRAELDDAVVVGDPRLCLGAGAGCETGDVRAVLRAGAGGPPARAVPGARPPGSGPRRCAEMPLKHGWVSRTTNEDAAQ